MTDKSLKGREIIIEFQNIGAIAKITAIDTLTMTEVSIQGPVSAGETVLKNNAIRRLEYVLRKKGILI